MITRLKSDWCSQCGWEKVRARCVVCDKFVCSGCKKPYGRDVICSNECDQWAQARKN